MCKEEFASLQRRYLESGKTLKEFLVEIGVGYSTYNYWRKKFHAPEDPHELVPIRLSDSSRSSAGPDTFSQDVPAGATLLFPNGLRAHFGSGTEEVLMKLLEKSLSSHVLS